MVRALVSVFVLVAATSVASAQAPNPDATKLFEEGRELAAKGQFAAACEKFQMSLELDNAIGTQLNLADCHEKQNHNAQAWRLFDGAADAEKMTNPERAKYSRGRADALLAKTGVVILKLATPDVPMIAVSIAGRTVRAAPVIKEIVDPGEVAIAVTAQNAPPFQKTEKVGAGKSITIEVPALDGSTTTTTNDTTVGTVGPGPGNGDLTTPPEGSDQGGGRRRSRVMLAYAVGGLGAVSLLTGVVLGVKAKGDYNEQFDNNNCTDGSPPRCNDTGFDAQNDAVSLANVGTVFGVGGVVLIGAGAVLFLTAPKEVVVTPTATATSGGISVVGRF